ncbi:MAG: hypothetical protein Q4B54_14545, partial [Coriobacteriales bacterium]|nr:hypothetical protein [Coriobacteriales bacterium]
KYVQWIDQPVKVGISIVRGVNASEAIAFVDLQFEDYETQQTFLMNIENYIYAVINKKQKGCADDTYRLHNVTI